MQNVINNFLEISNYFNYIIKIFNNTILIAIKYAIIKSIKIL